MLHENIVRLETNPFRNYTCSENYTTLQTYSIPPLIRFFEYLNNEHFLHGPRYNGFSNDVIETNKTVFSASSFYKFFKQFRSDWGYKSADWSNTLFGTHLQQFILDENSETETVIPYKFIAKRKSSVVCYVLDNVKMIKYLQKEGIIGDDKSFSNNDDTDSDHDSE